jgi:hypothetical protein
MSPVLGGAQGTIWIVLVEEVISSVPLDEPVRIIEPVVWRGEMVKRTVWVLLKARACALCLLFEPVRVGVQEIKHRAAPPSPLSEYDNLQGK